MMRRSCDVITFSQLRSQKFHSEQPSIHSNRELSQIKYLKMMSNLLLRGLTSNQSISPFPGLSCMALRWRKHRRPRKTDWEIRQNMPNQPLKKNIPDGHKMYNENFENLTLFEHQINSLQKSGFHRPYTPYTPPRNMENRFFKICNETIPGGLPNSTDLSKVYLDTDLSLKSKLLAALANELEGHTIPNSMLHTMKTLDKVLHFYSTQIDLKTPYERLEAGTRSGELPPNLTIQLEAHRFDPENGTNELDTITAFPRSSTIMVTPEARRKYKDVIAKHPPWKYSHQ